VDVFSDGLMVGTGSTISMSLALVLAVGQVTADIPEGFVTVANFRSRGMPRARRLLVSASFLVPVLVGAFLSYTLLKGQTGPVRLLALAFVAGLLLVAAVEEIVGEAHDVACDKRWTSMAITAGFVLFALVDSYFEG
jgi:ZIP family zinc transporter